jgi:hypothetical protein
MSRSNIFGPLTNPQELPVAVRNVIIKWIDTYLSEVERNAGLEPRTLIRPQSYSLVNIITSVPSNEVSPLVLIVTRGLNGTPVKNGDSYDLPLDVGLAIVTNSFMGDEAREAAGRYAIATAGILLHRRTLDGAIEGSCRVESWDDMRLDDLPATEQGSRAIVRLEFTVILKDVLRTGVYGPPTPEPPPDPVPDPGPFPTVAETTVTLKSEDIL